MKGNTRIVPTLGPVMTVLLIVAGGAHTTMLAGMGASAPNDHQRAVKTVTLVSGFSSLLGSTSTAARARTCCTVASVSRQRWT